MTLVTFKSFKNLMQNRLNSLTPTFLNTDVANKYSTDFADKCRTMESCAAFAYELIKGIRSHMDSLNPSDTSVFVNHLEQYGKNLLKISKARKNIGQHPFFMTKLAKIGKATKGIGEDERLYTRRLETHAAAPLHFWIKNRYELFVEEKGRLARVRKQMQKAKKMMDKFPDDNEEVAKYEQAKKHHDVQFERVSRILSRLPDDFSKLANLVEILRIEQMNYFAKALKMMESVGDTGEGTWPTQEFEEVEQSNDVSDYEERKESGSIRESGARSKKKGSSSIIKEPSYTGELKEPTSEVEIELIDGMKSNPVITIDNYTDSLVIEPNAA